jgi:hypothetical protein
LVDTAPTPNIRLSEINTDTALSDINNYIQYIRTKVEDSQNNIRRYAELA